MVQFILSRTGAREEAEAGGLRGGPGEAAPGEQGEARAAEARPGDEGRRIPARKGDLDEPKILRLVISSHTLRIICI